MVIAGYAEYEPEQKTFEVQVYLADEVVAYLAKEGRKGTRNERHVRKAQITLKTLKRDGLDRVRDSFQFKREGKFPSGRKIGGDQVVYEVKSDQVRIYGGPVFTGNKTTFFFVEAVTKQKDKADQEQLKRVAKRLGVLADGYAEGKK